MNKLRTNPSAFIPYLEQLLTKFHKNNEKMLMVDGEPATAIRTREGPVAVNDAIEFLRRSQPVRPLEYSSDLSLAAKDHVEDIGPKGLL